MELGAFSVSLNVKNIEASKSFYEKIGFSVFAGEMNQNWLIMKNGNHTIGLFQGMLEKNLLTFNPGWDQNCNTLNSFADVRDLHKEFKEQGLNIESESFDSPGGPANFIINDPDGNPILIDQHV